MAVAGQVAVKFTADVAQYVESTEKLKKKNKEVGDSTDDLGKRLKKALGEESNLGLIGKALVGAGAVAGVTAILNGLNGMAEKAVDLKKQFNDGQIGAGEMADELAKSIPILGRAWELGRNIREVFKGEGARDEAMAKYWTTLFEFTRKATDLTADLRREREKLNNTIPRNMAKGQEGPLGFGMTNLATGFFDKQKEIQRNFLDRASSEELVKVSEQINEMHRQGNFATGSLEIQRRRLQKTNLELRDAEEKLNRELSAANAVWQAVTNAAKALGNELNNPTTGIGGFLARVETKSGPVLDFFRQWGDDVARIKDEAKGLLEAIQTPLEKYGSELRKIQRMQGMGLLNPDEVARAQDKAFRDIFPDGDFVKGLFDRVKAITDAYTSDAQRMLDDKLTAPKPRQPAAPDARPVLSRQFTASGDTIPAKQLTEQQKLNRMAEELVKNTAKAGAVTVVTIAD